MGCDGGTIPRRDELVKTKKKPEQKDKNADAIAKWRHCALSQQELKRPIVACELGKLYNKDAIIEYLLEKEKSNGVVKHIRNLKDVRDLKLTDNPNYESKKADKGDEYVDHQTSPYICPIVGLEMNGKYKFIFLWKCGCVMSERALKKLKSESCTLCGTTYDALDIITLNPIEDHEEIVKKMEERRELRKKASKNPKRVKNNLNDGTLKKAKLDVDTSINESKLLNGPSTSNDSSANVKMSTKFVLPDKAKPSYSIAKDPKASEALKSLFTTHKTAQLKVKPHWVTHNSLFY